MQNSYPASTTGAQVPSVDAGTGKTFYSIKLKVTGPAADSVVSVETSPDDTTYTEQARVTGPAWCSARSDHRARYVRANVVSLGTGGAPLAAIVTAVGSG
jgi:hypothetical protein